MYGRDLAYVHDRGFTQVAEAAARELLPMRPARLVDLGCGGGALCEILADLGWDVQGIDISQEMLDLAKRRVPKARFQQGDVATCHIPPADVITAIGEVLCYACAEEDHLDGIFTRVRDALPTDGLFLFDLATKGRAAEPTHAAIEGRDWRVEARAEEEDGMLIRTIRTWRDGVESQEVHRLRLFDVSDIIERLEAAGFDVEHLLSYDDHALQPGWDAFRATAV